MKVEAWFEPGHQVTNYGMSCAHLAASFPDKNTVELCVSSNIPGKTDSWGRLTNRLPLPSANVSILSQILVSRPGRKKIELTDAVNLIILKR